jgi:predicted TIM-barrel fold metal-dependent hydrolase
MKGRFGGPGGAREFVDTAPLSDDGRAKLGHLNAERLLNLKSAGPEA